MLETTPGICNYFLVTKKAMSLCHIIYKVIYFCNIVALEPLEGSSHQEEPVLDLCSLFSAHSTCIDRLLVTLLPPLDLSNVHSY